MLARAHRWSLARRLTSKRLSSSKLEQKYVEFAKELEALPESSATKSLAQFLQAKSAQAPTTRLVVPPTPPPEGYYTTMDQDQIRSSIDAALATFCLHVESRRAALVGEGFYTIGPCGEETLSSTAHALQDIDSVALHYRHLGINLVRQLRRMHDYQALESPLDQLLLDRARGYTVSRNDPVTGGVHCSIGSAAPSNDYIVTSTLASQCPSAVGRALGYALVDDSDERPVSFVTVGDGSVHNHHFWSAFHLARHARHRRIRCPVVFGISDNGLSISYSTGGYVDTLFGNDPLVPLFRVNGNDMMDVYAKTAAAVKYARSQSAPAVLLYSGLVRRFGHAASDRQGAYLDEKQIQAMADIDILESAIVQAVEVLNAATYAEIRDRLADHELRTRQAFGLAVEEAKLTREDMLERVSAPLVPVARTRYEPSLARIGKREVMRKHMTRVIDEALAKDESVVYLGEDVRHGGYYVVTEGLANKYPRRILDFPPDETSLLGAAMGFAQLGLTPIVEIPYAKYLDCCADMFYEVAIAHWLSNRQRSNGMVIRLQGFDRGLFGGNFHTTNMLQHVPPGVDVVCFSNGEDYVRGFRHALLQAKGGRVVMSVDCTNLLNLRHLHGRDRAWERPFPSDDELLGFEDIQRYGSHGSLAIVTFGNGVVTALQARRALFDAQIIPSEDQVDVIDCPYLSGVPEGLREIVSDYKAILFADICKEGPGSSVLSSTACTLHNEGLLPSTWRVVGASRTYNPLGSMSTFLNEADVVAACKSLLGDQ